MTVAITDYTDSDAVRAVAGVSDVELSDDALQAMRLADMVVSDLNTWLPTHATVYSEGVVSGATAQQKTTKTHLELYTTLFAASKINLFKLAIKQSATNGKDALKRFEGTDFDALALRFAGEAHAYRKLIEAAVGATSDNTPTQIFGSASPSYDPVTGS